MKRRPGTVTLTATKSTRILTRPIMTRPIDETWSVDDSGTLIRAERAESEVARLREALDVIATCPPEAVHLMPLAAQAALATTSDPVK